MRDIEVFISSESISYLEHDSEQPLMAGAKTQRASWILPERFLKRLAFQFIRLFGDKTVAAEWTRRWQGPWIVDLRLSGGPVVTGFYSRDAALAYEESWVSRRLGA